MMCAQYFHFDKCVFGFVLRETRKKKTKKNHLPFNARRIDKRPQYIYRGGGGGGGTHIGFQDLTTSNGKTYAFLAFTFRPRVFGGQEKSTKAAAALREY